MKIGNLDIDKFYLGNSSDVKIYLGDTKLYPEEEPTPSFNGKWLATYAGGTTSSAECGSSSVITKGEITLTDLQTVEIGDCVTSIGNYAFYNCSTLTSVAISNSVTSIGESAFEMCINLTSVIIGNSVETIDEYTFFGCTSLTSITIPNSVTSIGDAVFSSCQGLTSVTVLATTPPTLGGYDVFYDTNNCPIYVLAASLEAYKTASRWSSYASRIQAIPT